MRVIFAVGLLFSCLAPTSFASPPESSPQGMERTYAQNYRDMVLATCIANAYKGEKSTAMDAGSSVTALREWAYYDFEKSPDAVKALIDKYLARDYTNPLVESEIKGVKFDLLNCLDLYHSKELNSLVKEVMIKPGHTYIQDNK
ncbi:type VI secretion system amidase immunity protein Tai4 [Pseudomonas coronafaciens]|uniref:type VI secretion system amidase immunity protein Tai4 n=1 Tax=Pseudomonas coronafaciens TaxID=53409 RepID=UPI0037977A2A